MKKLLIAAPLLVCAAGAAALAGTSQYVGSYTKTEYHRLLAILNEQTPLVFMNQVYTEGLTSSNAITKVMSSQRADAKVLFSLHHDIQHATFRLADDGVAVGTVSIDTTLLDKPPYATEFSSLFQDNTPFTLKTDFNANGEIRNQLDISAIEFSEEGKQLSWSGLVIDMVTKDSATKGDGAMGRISYADIQTGAKSTIESASMKIDLTDHGDNIFTGSFGLEASQLSLHGSGIPGPVSIASVTVRNDADIENDLMNTGTSLSINNIDSLAPVNNVSLSMRSNALVVEGLRQYNKVMKAVYGDLQGEGSNGALSQVTDAVRSMVEPGSAIDVELMLDNSDGDVHADLHVGLKDTSEPGVTADALDSVVTGRDLVNLLSLRGSVNADAAALSNTPVNMLLANGPAAEFFSITDESVSSDMRLDGTILRINDIDLPLGAMLMGMMEIPLAELTDQM